MICQTPTSQIIKLINKGVKWIFKERKIVFTLADNCMVKLATFSWEDSNSRFNLRICYGQNYKTSLVVISPQIELKSSKTPSLMQKMLLDHVKTIPVSRKTAFIKMWLKSLLKQGVRKKTWLYASWNQKFCRWARYDRLRQNRGKENFNFLAHWSYLCLYPLLILKRAWGNKYTINRDMGEYLL